MYTLSVKDHFDSAHFLSGYKGKCAQMHGHTWTVEVLVKGPKLDRLGLLVDFTLLKRSLSKIVGLFDHDVINSHLQSSLEDTQNNPTAENLSRYIFEAMKKELKGSGAEVASAIVWESANAWSAYTEE